MTITRIVALAIAVLAGGGGSTFTGESAADSHRSTVVARYPNGQVMYRRQYLQGREDGEHLGWWADGRVHFIYHYAGGRLEGEAREWYPNGVLYRDAHYVAGQETGSQRMWYPDGVLRANYVVRNGRRYGLPGTKGCVGHDSMAVGP